MPVFLEALSGKQEYSGTSLSLSLSQLWTPWGPSKVSSIIKRGVLTSAVNFDSVARSI